MNNSFKPAVDSLKNYFSKLPDCVESRRIFHGRGKCFPGLDWLSIDVHPGFVLITVFNPAFDQQNEDVEFDQVVKALIDELNLTLASVDAENDFALVVQRRDQTKAPFDVIRGEFPKNPIAVRKNAQYKLSFSQQNVGYFLDIEPARQWLESQAKNATVLNLFSYTCTFSVVAMMAGADSVVNFDLSQKSLSRGRENHAINKVPTESVRFFPHDILKSWGKIRRFSPYDVVIIDPPSFQKGSFIARKDYRKVLVKMGELLSENGRFLACLNAPEISEDEFKGWVEEACPGFGLEKALPSSEDFPENEEGKGLKMLVFSRND